MEKLPVEGFEANPYRKNAVRAAKGWPYAPPTNRKELKEENKEYPSSGHPKTILVNMAMCLLQWFFQSIFLNIINVIIHIQSPYLDFFS